LSNVKEHNKFDFNKNYNILVLIYCNFFNMKHSPKYTESELLDKISDLNIQKKDIYERKGRKNHLIKFDWTNSNELYDLPKWIRKLTRELKSQARVILWDNYLDYFIVDTSNILKIWREITDKKIRDTIIDVKKEVWESWWWSPTCAFR